SRTPQGKNSIAPCGCQCKNHALSFHGSCPRQTSSGTEKVREEITMKAFASWFALTFAMAGILHSGLAVDEPQEKNPRIIGRWDLTVKSADESYPSWLEVRRSGYQTLVGTFVGRFGSARPISRV